MSKRSRMAEAAKKEHPLREYEVIYILRPDVTKETAEKVATRVSDVVQRLGGKLTRIENWGRRLLSYEINHSRRGLYVYVTYQGDGALVAELERNFRMLDEVIRFQTVKIGDEAAHAEIDPETLKFEAEDAPLDEEEGLTLEQRLGLVASPRGEYPVSDDLREEEEALEDFS
jgi:small subunit ribosomal protein S6